MRALVAGVVGLILLTMDHAAAQTPPPDTVIRSDVRLVVLDAQVVDRASNVPLNQLRGEDFEILEDGVAQSLETWRREETPLSIIILLDVSGSIIPYVSELSAGALAALDRLKTEDEVAIMTFGNLTSFGSSDGYAKVLQPFTKDRAMVAARLKNLAKLVSSGGGTNIPFALTEATKVMNLATHPLGRRTIIAITDNLTAALPPLRNEDREKLLSGLFQSNSVVCGLTIGSPMSPMEASMRLRGDAARALAAQDFKIDPYVSATGGEVLPVQTDGVSRKLGELFDRLRNRYTITYTPTDDSLDGKFRRVSLRLSEAARKQHPQAVIKTRRGYYAKPR